jgi:hypothetical protein
VLCNVQRYRPQGKIRRFLGLSLDYVQSPRSVGILGSVGAPRTTMKGRHAGRRRTSLADRLSKVAGTSDRGRFAALVYAHFGKKTVGNDRVAVGGLDAGVTDAVKGIPTHRSVPATRRVAASRDSACGRTTLSSRATDAER